MCDSRGARWIWKVVKELYPKALKVLDYYHLCEHLHKLAEAQYGHDPERRRNGLRQLSQDCSRERRME